MDKFIKINKKKMN